MACKLFLWDVVLFM